jgi:hypothetical protein
MPNSPRCEAAGEMFEGRKVPSPHTRFNPARVLAEELNRGLLAARRARGADEATSDCVERAIDGDASPTQSAPPRLLRPDSEST